MHSDVQPLLQEKYGSGLEHENCIIESRRISTDSQCPLQRSQSLSWRPDPHHWSRLHPDEPAQHRTIHGVRSTRTRNHFGSVLALSTALIMCHLMPRPCISARSPADYCVNHGTQLFSCCLLSHRFVARMHSHEGMHLLEQGCNTCTLPCMLPIVGQFSLPSERYWIRFSPRHTRQPLAWSGKLPI